MNIKILCLCLFICTQTIAVESVVDQAPLPAMMVETLKSSEMMIDTSERCCIIVPGRQDMLLFCRNPYK